MKTMLTIAALFAASLATPVLAQEPSTVSVGVGYADLDLSADAGVRALDRRIHNAAVTACGIPSSADPRGKRAVNQCREEARERAYSQREVAIALTRRANVTNLAAAQ